ncbi:MAG: FHA domain-containing protein [Anaerolineales bacterium]|nr:FHA domain-containing protein [Anaerolineales bacterium]
MPAVSRYHAVIERMGKRFRILDLQSTNGVYVNGVLIEKESWLKAGDHVKIGPYGFIFSGGASRWRRRRVTPLTPGTSTNGFPRN